MSLADDWAGTDQRSIPWRPGWFRTAQTNALYENKEWVDYLCDRIPMKRNPDSPKT